MGKKNQQPQIEAPVVESKEEKKTPATKVDVLQVGDMEKLKQSYAKNGGLDPNHRVDVLVGIKTYFKDDPNAAANIGVSQEVVNKINGIAAIGFVAALGDEVMMGQSGWAHKMRMTQIEAINEVNALTGISIDVKALPAPDENGEVLVEQKNIKMTKETKEQLKKEAQVASDEKAITDPTKIENEEQLKKALGFQLVNPAITRPIDKIVTAANFYRSYLSIQANKSDNKDAELEKIKKFTLAELLQDISQLVPPTFVANGFGKYLYGLTSYNKNVVPAFCNFKRAATNRETGVCKLTDEEIAAVVRTLIVWAVSSQIAEAGKSIEDHNNNIKLLSKDEKANAKGIESEKKRIEECNNLISALKNIMGLVTEPDFDMADNFIAAYNKADNANHKVAHVLYKSIMETYYPGADIPELELDSALLNVQQRIGIILNLFNSPLGKREEYSEENLIDISSSSEEKKPEGEESKNS